MIGHYSFPQETHGDPLHLLPPQPLCSARTLSVNPDICYTFYLVHLLRAYGKAPPSGRREKPREKRRRQPRADHHRPAGASKEEREILRPNSLHLVWVRPMPALPIVIHTSPCMAPGISLSPVVYLPVLVPVRASPVPSVECRATCEGALLSISSFMVCL